MAGDLRARIARALVQERRAHRWSQRELAAMAGVSQSTVARIELGRGASPALIERVLGAAGAEVRVTAVTWSGTKEGDLVHRTGIATLRRLFVRSGFPVATEQAIVDGPFRGWIDLLAFDERCARLIVVEFKSSVPDLGATQRQVERYARACLQAARALGWRPRSVVVVLVILATEEADAFVAANRDELKASFPVRGRAAVRAILDGGPVEGRCLLALDPFRSGRQVLTSFRVDGRRRPFRLRSVGDARRLLEAGAGRFRRPRA